MDRYPKKKQPAVHPLQSPPPLSCWNPSAFTVAVEAVEQGLVKATGERGGIIRASIRTVEGAGNPRTTTPSMVLTPDVQKDLRIAGRTLQKQLGDKPQVVLMPTLLVNNKLHFMRMYKSVPLTEDNPPVPEQTNVMQSGSYRGLSSKVKIVGKPDLVGYVAGELKQKDDVSIYCPDCATVLTLLEIPTHCCKPRVPG